MKLHRGAYQGFIETWDMSHCPFFQTPQGPPSLGIFYISSRKNIFFPRNFAFTIDIPPREGICKKRHFFHFWRKPMQDLGVADRPGPSTKTYFRASIRSDMTFPALSFFRPLAVPDRGNRGTKTHFWASIRSDMTFPALSFFRPLAVPDRGNRGTKTHFRASIRSDMTFPALSFFRPN